MKKKFLLPFLSLFLLWFAPTAVFAVEPDLIITTEVTDGAIVACGNEQTVTVKIKNNTTSPITLNGLNLFSTTSTLIQVVTPLPSGWQNSGCAAGYTYCPTSATSIIPGQVLPLTFKVKAGCDIIPAVENGQQNFFDVKVLYNTSLVGLQQSVSPVNIFYPNYSISATASGVTFVGGLLTRAITICNSGNGFNPNITLTHTHDPGTEWVEATYTVRSPNNTILSSGTATHTVSGNTDNYTITDNNPEVLTNLTDQKRCYVITEKFRITGCGQINSTYTATWGCNNQICKSVSTTSGLVVRTPNSKMEVKQYSFTKPDFCTPGKIVYQLVNTGPDPAGDIVFDLPYTPNVTLSNGKIGWDNTCSTSGVSLPSASPYHVDISSLTALQNTNLGIKLVNGKLVFDGYRAVYVCFDVAYKCPTTNDCATYGIGPATLDSKDLCGNIKPTSVLAANESKVCWSTCGARFNPDMKVGDVQKLKICYNASTSQVPCDGQYTVVYRLPAGLEYVAGTASVDGSPYSNVTYTVTPTVNIIAFRGIDNSQGLRCFEINVKLTCTGTNGGPKIKEFLPTFKLTYQCNKNSNCCNINVADYNFKIFGDMTTCPNVVSENCLQTTNFTVKRNTFGTDPLTNQPATASTPGIALDRAYPCDEVLACASGKWISSGGGLGNAFIDVEFEQPANILQFVSGTIEVLNSAGGLYTTCDAGTPVTTIVGTKYKQRFTVSCGYPIKINYTINLCAKYRVLDDPLIGHGPILSVFRATYGYNDANGTEISCLGKGDQLTLIRPSNNFQLSISSTQAKPQCEPLKVALAWTTETCFEDDFPNEIRNINKFADYKLNYPTGYNLLDVNYVNVTCNGTTTTPIKAANIVNCTHPFTLLPAFPMIDKCSNTIQQRLEFNLQPTCLAPANGNVSTEITYKNFPGTACEKQETQTLTAPLNNYQPKLSIAALPPSVNSATNSACWTINVENDFLGLTGPVNAYLKFPVCNGITINSVGMIMDGDYVDLTSNLVNGQFPINSGGSYQVCGSYKCPGASCSVELYSGCGAPYFCNSTTVPQYCFVGSTPISVTPLEGLLQTTFDVPSEVPDVCNDIDMSYTITNAGQATLYDLKTKITSFPSCWSAPKSVCITYPGQTPVCNPSFNLLNGITLSDLLPPLGVRVSFKVTPTCDLLNCTSAAIVMETTAKKGCGDIITNSFTSKNLVFTSKPDYAYTPTITAEPFTYCTATDLSGTPAKDGISTVTFNLLVTGAFPNTLNDLITINIPAGFQYVANSFVPLATTGSVTFLGTTGTCPNAQTVNLKINSAVAANGTIKFSVNVIRCNALDVVCGLHPFSIAITQHDKRTCTATGLNCQIGDGVVTNSTDFKVLVQKPSFSISDVTEVTPLGLCNPSGSINLTLTNTGGLALGAGETVPIDIYCSTTCPSIVCGSSLPAGVTLLTTYNAPAPGVNSSLNITIPNIPSCAKGPYLFFRVGATCSPAVCFCPTQYCHTLVRPSVNFSVANVCQGAPVCIINNSNDAGQPATYSIKITSVTGATTFYTSTPCTTPNCTFPFCVTIPNLIQGTYKCILTQTIPPCGDISKTVIFSVYPLPTVTVSPTASTVCNRTPVTLTASGASSYTWSPVTGLTPSTGATVVANPTVTTIYTVTGSTTLGCSATATTTVTINPTLVVAVPDDTICIGSCILPNFASKITGGTPYVNGTFNYYLYTVTGPNGFEFTCSTLPGNISGAACDGTTPFCDAGTYTITVTDSKGCTATDQFQLSTKTCCEPICGKLSPDAIVDMTYTKYTIYEPFIKCTTDPITIDWNCNRNKGPLTIRVREIYDTRYTFSLYIPNSEQTHSFNNYLDVQNLRNYFAFEPNHWYEIYIFPNTPVTCGENGIGIYMFLKSMDCVHCTANFTVDIPDRPTSTIECNPQNPRILPLHSTVTGSQYQYTWLNFPEANNLPGGATISPTDQSYTNLKLFTDLDHGMDGGKLVLTVTDNQGCRATTSADYSFRYGAQSPSPTNELPLKIEALENGNLFKVMPNPNNGSFTIMVDLDDEKNVFVYDMRGKIVFEKTKTKDQSFNIDISHLAKGIYLVKVSDGKHYETKKVVVQ